MSKAFNELLENYRKYAFSKRDKGDKFERLMQGFLMTNPTYENLFKKFWLWNEFPGKKDFGGKDTTFCLSSPKIAQLTFAPTFPTPRAL